MINNTNDDSKSTKQKILDSSLKLFSKNGYSGASVRQISKEAGFRESVIYNHFDGKYDILKTLFFTEIEESNANLIKEIDIESLEKHPKDILELLASRLTIYSKDEKRGKVMKIIIMEMFRDKKAKELMKGEVFGTGKNILAKFFTDMIEKGIIKDKNPSLLAEEFMSFLFYLNIRHLLADSEEEDLNINNTLIKDYINHFWENVKSF